MAPLHGIGVLVTRPEQQATPLCRLLQAQGAETLRLPAIDIRPLPDSSARIGTLDAFDIIVLTSANAVRYGAALLEASPDSVLAAIGAATARALREHGYDVTLEPDGGFSSEALLAHPAVPRQVDFGIAMSHGKGQRSCGCKTCRKQRRHFPIF